MLTAAPVDLSARLITRQPQLGGGLVRERPHLYRRRIVSCILFAGLGAATLTRDADEMADGVGACEREWAFFHRHVDLRRALVLAHVLTPGRRAEGLHEQPGLRDVLVQLPPQRAVATTDRGQLPHGRHE